MEVLLGVLGCRDKELSILFTDDRHISELNGRYLNRKGPTNVLAFPMEDGVNDPPSVMLGDIVISLDTAEREAASTGESLVRTVDRLLIHGLLHLMGFDHERSDEEAEVMEEKEKMLLSIIERRD
jgi:rRNA maturation RNase YbeY